MRKDIPSEIVRLPLDEIEIGTRQRGDLGDLEILAKDIQEHGLLNPITVSGKRLIAGMRRLSACRSLGWTHIDCHDIAVLDPYIQKEIELAENIKRKDLTWPEQCRAVNELLAILKEQHGERVKGHTSDGFGVQDMAEYLGWSVGAVSEAVKMAQALEHDPSLEDYKKYTTAKKIRKKKMETIFREIDAEIKTKEEEDSNLIFQNTDALTFLQSIESKSIHCIITDPPWGVSLQDIWSSASWDNVDGQEVIREVMPEFARVLVPGGFIHIFFSMWRYSFITNLLRQYFKIDPLPIIWFKGTVTGIGRTYRQYGHAYEPIYFAQKGEGKEERTLNDQLPNVLECLPVPESHRYHNAQKPLPLLKTLINNSTTVGEIVLDPFAGSGATLKAALALGRRAVGCEDKKKIFEDATHYLGKKEE